MTLRRAPRLLAMGRQPWSALGLPPAGAPTAGGVAGALAAPWKQARGFNSPAVHCWPRLVYLIYPLMRNDVMREVSVEFSLAFFLLIVRPLGRFVFKLYLFRQIRLANHEGRISQCPR